MAKRSEIPLLRDLRYRLEYLGLRFLIGMVRLVSIDMAATISAKAWRLIAPLNRRRHNRALANLARRHDFCLYRARLLPSAADRLRRQRRLAIGDLDGAGAGHGRRAAC
ncbi:MAG: hypothetical protein WD852_07690 [Methyloceanibacter sp.]